MARCVRQGCLSSGFNFYTMAFDPIFRCLQEVFIPKNPDNLDFLQPTQCAYADDLAVAAMFFRELMTALAPAFRSVDYIAGLNLNYRNAVGFGTALKDVNLCGRVSENCEEFREMQIVRHAEYVGPDGHIHCCSAPRKNHPARAKKSMRLPRAWFSDCATSRSMRFLC